MHYPKPALVLCSLLLLFYYPSYAQGKDYIVTLQKDTVYGDLRFGLNGRASKLVTHDTAYSINPNETSSYYSSNRRELYRSRTFPGKEKPYFMVCFVSGPISLYLKSRYLFAEKKGIFVHIKSNATYVGSSNGFKKDILLNMISDIPEIADSFKEDKKKLEWADVVYYVSQYNRMANRTRSL